MVVQCKLACICNQCSFIEAAFPPSKNDRPQLDVVMVSKLLIIFISYFRGKIDKSLELNNRH